MLPCRPQHFPGGQKCFLEGKRSIWAARQVMWPAWEHCCVVRFPSSTDDEGLWVQKTIKKLLLFIGLDATMAESETSSSILIVWLAWEHYFGKVVLWRQPNAGSGASGPRNRHWQRRSACSKCCTGHTDRQAPTAALATRINMLHMLHWRRRSPCSKCRTAHTDRHAPTVALAAQIGLLQVLHCPHISACSKCCTGHTDPHALSVALPTHISILEILP